MKRDRLFRLIFTGVMAAMVFVTTYFLKIPIPTPAGQTMLKVSNVICLLSGMLFGPLLGGLASGLGSALYDLTDPVYAASAWITFINFFIMGAVCGLIAHARPTFSMRRYVLAAFSGALAYFVLYITKSVLTLMVAGSAFWPAVVACSTKMVTSGTNAIIAVVFASLLIRPIRAALKAAGVPVKN